jgi:hypothetical protein
VGQIGKNTTLKKTKNLSSVFQNGLAFLGRIGKASLSEFPEIYWIQKCIPTKDGRHSYKIKPWNHKKCYWNPSNWEWDERGDL